MARKRIFAAWVAWSICGLSLLVAGCGGGSVNGGGDGGGAASPTNVTVDFKGPAPTAVASKIGTGAFAAQSLSSGTLILSIPDGTSDFAVAYVCPPQTISIGTIGIGPLTRQTVLEASTADGTSFSTSCPQLSTTPGQTGKLTLSLDSSAIPGVSFRAIQAQGSNGITSTVLLDDASNFSFDAPAGNDRVHVLAYSIPILGTSPTVWLAAAKSFSNQPVPGQLNGGSPVVLGTADQTGQQTIAYENVPAGYQPSTSVSFATAAHDVFVMAESATDKYPVLPAALVQSGDAYSFIATARQASASGFAAVLANESSSTPAPMTFTFPAPWTYAGPSPAALPRFDFNYSGFAGNRSAGIVWQTGTGAPGEVTFSILSSVHFLNGSTTLTFPDLSSVQGFQSAPPSGTEVLWTAEVVQSAGGFSQGTSSNPGTAVINTGRYTVP